MATDDLILAELIKIRKILAGRVHPDELEEYRGMKKADIELLKQQRAEALLETQPTIEE